MRRCLIVANQTLTGPKLMAAVVARQVREPYEFHILVPASHLHGTAAWTEGEALAQARAALAHALDYFGEAGVPATGEVGDGEHIDEIIISTLPPGASRWLKRDLPRRLTRYGVPVSHVTAEPATVS